MLFFVAEPLKFFNVRLSTSQNFLLRASNIIILIRSPWLRKRIQVSPFPSSLAARGLTVHIQYASAVLARSLKLTKLNTFSLTPMRAMRIGENKKELQFVSFNYSLYTLVRTSVKRSPSRSRFSKANGNRAVRTSLGFVSSREMAKSGEIRLRKPTYKVLTSGGW